MPGGGWREERGQVIEFYFESEHSSTSDQEQLRCFTQWHTLRHGHCDVCYNIHYLSFLLSLTSLYYLNLSSHAKQGSWSYLSFQFLLLFSTSPKIFPCYLSNHKIQTFCTSTTQNLQPFAKSTYKAPEPVTEAYAEAYVASPRGKLNPELKHAVHLSIF